MKTVRVMKIVSDDETQLHSLDAGMDINMDRIAVSIVSKQGNFIQSKC
jgi:hypothetical protein